MEVHRTIIPRPGNEVDRDFIIHRRLVEILKADVAGFVERHDPAAGHFAIGLDGAIPILVLRDAHIGAEEPAHWRPDGLLAVELHGQHGGAAGLGLIVSLQTNCELRDRGGLFAGIDCDVHAAPGGENTVL